MNLNRDYAFDAETIASALQKAKRVRPGKYVACCPAHDDTNPSLSIEDAPSGKVLVKCWAGCSQDAVIDALRDLGLWHKPSRKRIQYLKNKSLKDEIWRAKMILTMAQSGYEQGVVYAELDRARIKRAIRFLEKHNNG
jgi:hypothetical protein